MGMPGIGPCEQRTNKERALCAQNKHAQKLSTSIISIVSLVLTKALLIMSVLIWTAEWHAQPAEPTVDTVSSNGPQSGTGRSRR